MWVWIFFPFLVLIYSSQSKKIKRLEKRLKVIERKEKGNIDMSRLLQELIGEKSNNHWTSVWNRQLGSCGC